MESNEDKDMAQPVKKFRAGFVNVAVWKNESDGRVFYNTTFSRSYKDSDGDYKDGDSFGHADLACVGKLADLAFNWIAEQE